MARRRYVISSGPRSGRGQSARRVRAALTRLHARGHEVRVIENTDVTGAIDSYRAAVKAGADVLVVAGGDGLVGLAAAACAESHTALSILPAGTGNDNARSLGIPLRYEQAVETLLRDRRRRVDLIQVTDATGASRIVLGSVPAGIDARIASRAARLPKSWGAAVYPAAVVPELTRLRAQSYSLELHTPGESPRTVELDALIVAVCNMPIYGGGMRIAPTADPTDGLADVVVIGPVGAGAALGLLRGVFSGDHLDHPAVSVIRVSRLRIDGPAHIAHGDGEPIGPLPVECTVLGSALEVVV